MFRRIFAVLTVIVFLASVPGISRADEVTELKMQVQQLMKRIEKMEMGRYQEVNIEKRITELENKSPSGILGAGWAEKVKVGGFLQATYKLEADGDQRSDFDVKRGRVIITGKPAEDWGFKFQFELDTTSNNARDLFVYYKGLPLGNKITFGQWVTPLAYEWSRGSKKLDTIIRANAFEASQTGNSTIFSDRQIGARLDGKILDNKLKYALAVVTGNGKNAADNNNSKDLVARLDVSPFKGETNEWLEGLIFGAAIQTGRQPLDGTIEGTRNRYIGTLRYDMDKFIVTSEYIYQSQERTGVLEDKLMAGWYFTTTYDITDKIRGVGRYEMLDPDKGVDDNKESIYTIGGQYFWNKSVRLDLNYRFIAEEGESVSNNELIFQTQLVF